ncbi:uncharacterized protein PRCAT00000947001 [Priceomyces carsonii]|uniref:uncharacterized protein n=1 Tax=Priceomyces carsonii TaxID=28549 RepID=UPI002ED908FB|nr:unnamed protein product [Priceomyces carsonii]
MLESIHNQETDLSSSDSEFSRDRSGIDSLATSHKSRTQDEMDEETKREIRDLELIEHEAVNISYIQKEDLGKSKNNLSKWAARLELESITLKETVKKDVNQILKENCMLLQNSYSDMSTRLDKLEALIGTLIGIQRDIKGSSKLNCQDLVYQPNVIHDLLKLISTKATQIEDLSKRDRSTKLKLVMENVFSQFSASLIPQSTFNQGIEKLQAQIKEMRNTLDSYQSQQGLMMLALGGLDEKIVTGFNEGKGSMEDMSKLIAKDQKLSSTKSTGKSKGPKAERNDDHTHISNELQNIKEFLKLLLPKVVGLNDSYRKLSLDYQILTLKENGANSTPNATIADNSTDLEKNSGVTKKRKLRLTAL